MRIAYLLIGILLASASFTADAQQRYRWIDENGVTRISDRIPPSANDKRIEVLNARGMVVRVIEPKRELSAEERAAAEAERIAAENAKAAAAEQARRDRMLLDTYTTVDDLVRSRDARVSALQSQITVSRDALDAHKEHLDDLEAQVAEHTNAGRDAPPALAKRLAETREKYESMKKFVETREAEQQSIRAQFDADIARFTQLRGEGQRED